MNLNEWLTYIGSIHHQEIDLGLERIREVARKLAVLKMDGFVITVAGTNGKGSCVATLDTLLRSAGYSVATYTSPHLLYFNERICLQGKPVADNELCMAFEVVEKARGNIRLTFFEFITLAAFLIFKQHTLDVLILEVGLGGRLDAVNIIDADIAVITTIALDHMDRLGNTRESIGFEKAGIFRPGQTIVCGDFSPSESLIKRATQLTSRFFCMGKDFGYDKRLRNWEWWGAQGRLQLAFPQLELQNVATALQVISVLPPSLNVPLNVIANTVPSLSLKGRFYVINGKAKAIFDVAHNPAGGDWLATQLHKQPCQGKSYAVLGMLSDKDHVETLRPFISLIDSWYVASLEVIRGCTADYLAGIVNSLGATQNVQCYLSPSQAWEAVNRQVQPEDRIVVFGSFHTVSGILAKI